MALDAAYFNSIQFPLVRRRFYDAGRVNTVLADIRSQAARLQQENLELREKLSRKETAEYNLASIQQLYRETLSKAEERADSIVREAEETIEQKLIAAENSTAKVMDCLNTVRRLEEQNLDYIQSCLRQLQTGIPAEHTSVSLRKKEQGGGSSQDISQSDLEKKISLLAKEIRELEAEE